MASIQERHPICTRKYWPLRDELHIIEGLVFRGETLVIPPSTRHELLTKLHESQLGIAKCKASARPIMYWPGMGRDIEEPISRFSICAKYKQACQFLRATYPSCYPRTSMAETRDGHLHIQGTGLSSSYRLLFQITRSLLVIDENCMLRDLTPQDLLCETWYSWPCHCRQHTIWEQWVCQVCRIAGLQR